MHSVRPFPLPERALRTDGGMRRLGVEIEFGGLQGEAIIEALIGTLGGTATARSVAEWRLEGTAIGPMRVELDSRIVQQVARDVNAVSVPRWLADITEWTTDVLERFASSLLPWEGVTGPNALNELHGAEGIVTALRDAGALGTRQARHFAFGVHLNPELPDLRGDTILAYFKAYLCLKDWLRERCRPDATRVVSPYISDFESDWVREVVSPLYTPSLEAFMDEYMRANPTRNRSLDLLPLFSSIDSVRVRQAVDDPLVSGRPALHYRLPNSEVDDEAFTLRALWLDWLEIERLAADADRLRAMGEAYASWLTRIRLPFDDGWARETTRWLH